jgi:hypothetical protein
LEIDLSGMVRGERETVRWHDGDLTGSEVLLERIAPLLADGRVDPDDVFSVVRGLEQVAGQRLELKVFNFVDTVGSP